MNEPLAVTFTVHQIWLAVLAIAGGIVSLSAAVTVIGKWIAGVKKPSQDIQKNSRDLKELKETVADMYFCHCERLLAQTGQRVKTGDALAVMGNTGNAALASPPYAHCHFEVRAFPGGRGLDPTAYAGVPNAVGTYGAKEGTDGGKPAPSDDKKEHAQAAQPARKESETVQELKIKPKDADDAAEIARMAFALGLPQQYTASVGDAITMWRTAKARGAEYSAREV